MGSRPKVKKDTQNMNETEKLGYFIENVKSYGSYDFMVMEPQDIGNYHFGYIGRAMGYDVNFLTLGAGIYQLFGDTRYLPWCMTSSLCDDPRDSYYIRRGAIAYDNEN